MTKKTNPKRRPCTEADVKKAANKATDIAVRRAIRMVLFILIDKHDAPAEDVQQLADEIEWLAGNIDAGRLSWSYVDKVLNESGLKFDWR